MANALKCHSQDLKYNVSITFLFLDINNFSIPFFLFQQNMNRQFY